ncbi:MAG: NADH:flavin oxidoreductase [Anaerolineaceae bacterium]|nr:NADH:flavin oxidoreductase [Anaerolineaceae bacterium]
MKKTFETIRIGNLKLRNRLIRSATWEGIAEEDGSISENTYEIYSELAKGGIGGIITGFTGVMAEDHYFDGMMRLCDDSLIGQYKKLTDLIHAEDCPVITQLALGAYYRENSGQLIQTEPDEMTEAEIRLVIRKFIDAAVRAEKAGFDGVQIHAAHFFFLSRFVSPAVNHRQDDFGGSTENRCRILLEIMKGIRKEAPSLHITAKINSDDFYPGGITPDECIKICRLLDKAGIDSIEVSGNGTSVRGIKAHVNEGYFVPSAAVIANEVSSPVIVVGGFRSLDTMAAVLNQTKIELISLSRPLLYEPDLPLKMQMDERTVSKCISCNRCYSSPSHKCVFRR